MLFSFQFPLHGPLPTRWKGYLDGSYDELLISWLNASQVAPKICRATNQGKVGLNEIICIYRTRCNIYHLLATLVVFE